MTNFAKWVLPRLLRGHGWPIGASREQTHDDEEIQYCYTKMHVSLSFLNMWVTHCCWLASAKTQEPIGIGGQGTKPPWRGLGGVPKFFHAPKRFGLLHYLYARSSLKAERSTISKAYHGYYSVIAV